MDDKKRYGLIKDNGIIKGTQNGVVGRVDKMYATLFLNLLKELNLNVDDARVESLRKTLVVKENTKGEFTYQNYYIDNKKILCIRNKNVLIGEVNMDENVAKIIIEELEKTLPKKDVKKDTKTVSTKASKNNKEEVKKENNKSDVEPKSAQNPGARKKVIVSPYAEETKKILSTISKESMAEKGFTFMTEDEYKKRSRF